MDRAVRRLMGPWHSVIGSIRGRVAFRACDSVGRLCVANFGWPDIVNRGRIELGARVWLDNHYAPVRLETGATGVLRIGDRTGINYGAVISAGESVAIGAGVSIAPYCVISDTLAGPAGAPPDPVVIEDGCWLATRVVVAPGAHIGRNAVISAGTHVTGTVEPNVVYGGAPPRVLRRLDSGQDPSLVPVQPPPVATHPVGQHQASSAAVEADGADPAVDVAEVSTPQRPSAERRALLVADFTIDPLADFLDPPDSWASADDPRITAEIAPFDQAVPTLLQASDGGDIAIVWTRPERSLPAWRALEDGEEVTHEHIERDVDSFAELLTGAARRFKAVLVPTWVTPTWRRGRGLADGRPGGEIWGLTVANARLMTRLHDVSNVFVLDAQRWVAATGAPAFNEQLWFTGKLLFGDDLLRRAATDIRAAVAALQGSSRKLIVLDLDNTLWGGVIGDVGVERLALGGHDPAGEAFSAFQSELRRLKNRGILLAVVSKNDEAVALGGIDGHDSMVLRTSDLVGWRINWVDKAQNIAELVEELNLGLQSVVFIDDNPHERARVRDALPEVFVPEWPENPVEFPKALGRLTCFDAVGTSAEDRGRTEMYNTERARSRSLAAAGSVQEWLESLEIVLTVDEVSPATVTRGAQLLNKTNQMNLTTRRLGEEEFLDWSAAPNRRTYVVSVADRIGDSGLTGLVSVEATDGTARIVDFVLSCRVFGRRVEEAMLALATEGARELGSDRLRAVLVPTEKNTPCQRFFAESDMKPVAENEYELLIADGPAIPAILRRVDATR